MCGIAGFYDPSLSGAETRARLHGMLRLIAHRGPDGGGRHIAGGLALGMTRLSLANLDRRLVRAALEDFLVERWDGARALYALWLYETWNRSLTT